MNKKKLVFLTGTRADFGKMKSLMKICENSELFEVYIFVTGMHLNIKYGNTVHEVIKENFTNIFQYITHDDINHMDRMLAKTIEGFSKYIRNIKPDMVIVHGDRLEALAGAIVGSFNNILVSHVEGGEVSGTIDESIRHSISKLAHIHFVSNDSANKTLIQMGENKKNIFTIGSPDLDIILNNNLSLDFVKDYYKIDFSSYAISLFHPVTTDISLLEKDSRAYCQALIESKKNYIIIFPNNDYGSDIILNNLRKYLHSNHFLLFPSIRFEYFSVLVKNAEFIIGNSSTGIKEAPYYPTKAINIGNRQNNRETSKSTIHIDSSYENILSAINNINSFKIEKKSCKSLYGKGNSNLEFFNILKDNNIWETSIQKRFQRKENV